MSRTAKTENMEFARRVREARRKAGFSSCAALGRSIGVDGDTVNGYELGRALPSAFVMARMCKELQVTPGWLCGFEDEPAAGNENAAEPGKAENAVPDTGSTAAPEEKNNLLTLVDLLDEFSSTLQGYLVQDGERMREFLQDDPLGDAAPSYFVTVCSKPELVNFYRSRLHMRALKADGVISREEYQAWADGSRNGLVSEGRFF